MKKTLLTAVAFSAISSLSFATNYMHIELLDGSENSFNVDSISQIYFDETSTHPAGIRPLPPPTTISGYEGQYAYVDLGLPSGRLWATVNVGANKVTEQGDIFSWAETQPAIIGSNNYTEAERWADYQWCDNHTFNDQQTPVDFSKYLTSTEFGDKPDNLAAILPEDDAATVLWGDLWRMPTVKEVEELMEGCSWTWIKNFNGSGQMGHLGVSLVNGNTIFLPARNSTSGKYWTKDIYTEKACYAYGLLINSPSAQNTESQWSAFYCYRNLANLIRPVLKTEDEIPVETTVSGQVADYDYVDLGLASGRLWATRNVGANFVYSMGDLYSWAEVEPAIIHSNNTSGTELWADYKWCENHTYKDGSNTPADFTKYVPNTDYGFDPDGLTSLLSTDDAASVNWGEDWRMPTIKDLMELLDGCEWTWVYNYNNSGAKGHIGVSKTNGNTIFLPARNSTSGYYWSSDLEEENACSAYGIVINRPQLGEDNCSMSQQTFYRNFAHTVRPVVK